MKLASVIIVTKNQPLYLKKCLKSLLNQTYQNYEIIIVDDNSTNETETLIKSLNSKKVKYFYNKDNKGIAALRNFGINQSKGDYIFFTDSDCLPVKNWIEEGVDELANSNVAGVEGKTIAEHQNYGASFRAVENYEGGQYQTCNIAYKKKYIVDCGMFDESYKVAYEDIDLAIRVKTLNKIIFCKGMLVLHQIVPWTFRDLISNAKRAKYKVLLVKKHNYRKILNFNILEINSLIQVIFPFLLLFYYRIKSVRDLYFIPLLYIRAVLHRLVVWMTSIINKTFIF